MSWVSRISTLIKTEVSGVSWYISWIWSQKIYWARVSLVIKYKWCQVGVE